MQGAMLCGPQASGNVSLHNSGVLKLVKGAQPLTSRALGTPGHPVTWNPLFGLKKNPTRRTAGIEARGLPAPQKMQEIVKIHIPLLFY